MKTKKRNSKKFLSFGKFPAFLIAVFALTAAVSVAMLSSHIVSANNNTAAPDQILLKFKPGAAENTRNRILINNSLTIESEIQQIEVLVLKVAPKARDKVISALSKNPAVEFAEANAIVKPEAVPNDTHYSSQWHHPKINSAGAWDSTTANGVVIGVCDTGFAQPADLAPSLLTALGYNTVDNSTNWSNDNGHTHGTRTAGTVAAVTNNNLGVAGVAWDAKVIPVRISNRTDGAAYTSDAAECITYSADNGAKAINLSYGFAGNSTIDSAGQYAQGKGAVTVVSAGNDNLNPGWVNYPGFLSVSATDSNDNKASFSSYGNHVDIAAPGVNILTTNVDGNYVYANGTSFSAPIVAGVLGLIFAANPSLTPLEAQNALLSNADDLGATGWDPYFGYGRVNADRAIKSIVNVTPDTESPTASISSPTDGSVVSGEISVNVNASDNVGVSKVELYINGVLFATDTNSPYSFFLDTTAVANADHILTAKAYDAAGNTGNSSDITVSVNNTTPTPTTAPTNTPTPQGDTTSPTVSITSPSDGATVNRNRTTTIRANASDNVSVTKVEFYVNGVLTCTDTKASYTCSWRVPSARGVSYNLTAKAYDAAGNIGNSSAINVTSK